MNAFRAKLAAWLERRARPGYPPRCDATTKGSRCDLDAGHGAWHWATIAEVGWRTPDGRDHTDDLVRAWDGVEESFSTYYRLAWRSGFTAGRLHERSWLARALLALVAPTRRTS